MKANIQAFLSTGFDAISIHFWLAFFEEAIWKYYIPHQILLRKGCYNTVQNQTVPGTVVGCWSQTGQTKNNCQLTARFKGHACKCLPCRVSGIMGKVHNYSFKHSKLGKRKENVELSKWIDLLQVLGHSMIKIESKPKKNFAGPKVGFRVQIRCLVLTVAGSLTGQHTIGATITRRKECFSRLGWQPLIAH